MIYTFEIEQFINLTIASRFRRLKVVKFLTALLSPLQTLYNNFIAYKDEITFKTNYSCQQRSLAALLNKIFAAEIGIKKFRIESFEDIKPKYYKPLGSDNSGLADPIYTGLGSEPNSSPLYFGFGNEYSSPATFIVYAPIEVYSKENQIISWVNYYRFGSKTFKIVYI